MQHFYPRPPRGGRRRSYDADPDEIADFYPRPPRGGRLVRNFSPPLDKPISIHALREEGDLVFCMLFVDASDFYPRPPRGGRPAQRRQTWIVVGISIHALREEGDVSIPSPCMMYGKFLSTPSARRATVCIVPCVQTCLISIHALREEGDTPPFCMFCSVCRFLSTPSARRATYPIFVHDDATPISIHALREEGDHCGAGRGRWFPISIHALREEGDCPVLWPMWATTSFLSTPSARRATVLIGRPPHFLFDFYPRPPRGGRLAGAGKAAKDAVFLSTPSARRATIWYTFWTSLGTFLSTPSARRATIWYTFWTSLGTFLSTPSARRATLSLPCVHGSWKNFYPRPPRGGRQQKQRENPLLLSHYTPLCTNCKEVPVKQTAKSHRYLCKRLVFRCEASGKTMCAACSHWRGIKRSVHYPAQTPGAAQHARP